MTKNITSVIKKVVEKIQSVVNTQEKYTIDGDENCIEWLKYLTIDNRIRLFPELYSAWLSYKNDHYLVLVNHEFPTSIPPFLEEVTINSGAWTAIIYELDLPLKRNIDELKLILQEILDNEDWTVIKNNKEEEFKAVNIDEEINGYTLSKRFLSQNLFV